LSNLTDRQTDIAYFCISVVFYSDLFYPVWMYVCCIWINQSVSQSVIPENI